MDKLLFRVRHAHVIKVLVDSRERTGEVLGHGVLVEASVNIHENHSANLKRAGG